MRIRSIVIEGDRGHVEIAGTEAGAVVGTGQCLPARPQRLAEFQRRVVCEVGREEDREDRFEKACQVAGVLYGATRGKPNATNSMVHDVLDLIDRVAGC